MRARRDRDDGFTLVELMVAMLIIGILITIAVPVYTEARLDAEAKSCQATQRSLQDAADLMRSIGEDTSSATSGVFAPGGSGWYAMIVPRWIRSQPSCPSDHAEYYMTAGGDITGDNGTVQTFKPGHEAP
jgi:prepilin-type N-terminal cleavage/methylation domain-containing protein